MLSLLLACASGPGSSDSNEPVDTGYEPVVEWTDAWHLGSCTKA